MKNNKTILGVVLLITILLLGIGYAAITGYTLTIGGTATATANTENFIIKITDATPGTNCTKAEPVSTDTTGRSATMEVSGLANANDVAKATFEVTNFSPDLNAKLSVTASQATDKVADSGDGAYFDITTDIKENTTSVAPEGTRTVEVTVRLKETIKDDKTATINIQLNAEPEEIK